MQRILKTLTPTLVTLGVLASIAWAEPGPLATQAGSKLWLTGSSTVHAYSSTASKLQVTLQQDATRRPAEVTGGESVEQFIRARGVTAIDVVVPVTGLHSGKDGLDRNMYKALQAEKHPEIKFHMTGYEIGAAEAPATMTIAGKGKLTIAGVEREVPMTVSANREGDVVRLRGEAALLMTQFGIKPPTMMMGALRTADQVVVHFDLVVGWDVAAGAVSNAR